MATFTAENREAWQAIFDDVAKERPGVGRTVRAFHGKHTGKIGIVRKHFVSRFAKPFRYGNSASHAMTQARGRNGYCVQVETTDGELFFVNAEYVMVCAT